MRLDKGLPPVFWSPSGEPERLLPSLLSLLFSEPCLLRAEKDWLGERERVEKEKVSLCSSSEETEGQGGQTIIHRTFEHRLMLRDEQVSHRRINMNKIYKNTNTHVVKLCCSLEQQCKLRTNCMDDLCRAKTKITIEKVCSKDCDSECRIPRIMRASWCKTYHGMLYKLKKYQDKHAEKHHKTVMQKLNPITKWDEYSAYHHSFVPDEKFKFEPIKMSFENINQKKYLKKWYELKLKAKYYELIKEGLHTSF